MLESVYKYLSRFVNVTKEEFDYISRFVEIRHLNKKVRLVNIGEKEKYISFIVKGVVRKYFFRQKEEVITQIAKEGELICSSVSFLCGVDSEYIVETIEPTTVLSISAENLEKIYAMGYKMERLGRLIIIDWLLQKEYWENERIQQGPKKRFINFLSNNPELLIRVPQKYLASYLNIKPETFSRYKHLLQRNSSRLQKVHSTPDS
jgi:CRP-like cAMP-binding protein